MRIARRGTRLSTVRANECQSSNLDVANLIADLGEIAAITNCTDILTDSQGDFRLSTSEAQSAFSDLSLYTNAESCPMVSPLYQKEKKVSVEST